MASDMDPHILNFYEDLTLPISDVPAIIDAALSGRLEDPREKLDGQNFTFTVGSNRDVRFMGKGCPKWIRVQGGLTRDEMRQHYADRPQVQEAFTGAMDALTRAVDVISASPERGMVDDLFRSGQTVVAAEVVTPINPNVVRYRTNAVCLIGAHDLGHRLGPARHTESFLRFQNSAQVIGSASGWSIMGIPIVEFKPKRDMQDVAELLKREFGGLLPRGNQSMTMGDLLTHYVALGLTAAGLPLAGSFFHRAARRLAYDDPSILKSSEFPGMTWSAFRPIDDERAMFVGEAIVPIESFFRKLGAYAIEAHEFKLADVDDAERITELKEKISRIKHAVRSGRVVASTPQILRRIESASRRVDETLFTRNVEGIVFSWKGQLRKLTGAFTAVNRLHGYFSFEDAARIVE